MVDEDGDDDEADGGGEGLGEGAGDGFVDGVGAGFEECEVADTAGAVSWAAGEVAVSAAGDEDDAVIFSDDLAGGFGEDEDGDADDEDGRSEIRCTSATEWAEVRSPGPPTARAVPAAATTATALTAMAAFNPRTPRNRKIRFTVLPWGAGGAPAGHSSVSSSAASPSCDRPRCCQSRP